ncbi:SacI homology domain-containing protein [Spinellus fusiger]|nr:SacI homology domain-containing protein [Spinellus fusiger]
MVLHEQLKLYITKDAYIIAPEAGSHLTLQRTTGHWQSTETLPPATEHENTLRITGIMGLVQLQAGDYLIVVTDQECIGTLLGHRIFRVTSFQILPLAQSMKDLSEAQVTLAVNWMEKKTKRKQKESNLWICQEKDEQTYVDLLESHLRESTFYYSPTYDLTHTLQRQAQFTQETLSEPLWKRADERFFWNKDALSRFTDPVASHDPTHKGCGVQCDRFILPVMQGFVEVETIKINDKAFVLGLLTRRSRHRAGSRYFSRGIDAQGHVSNFVETEQVVVYDDPAANGGKSQQRLSYVQTRGSIPIYWTQIINLKYTPRLWVGDSRKSLAAARSHFDEQIRLYGPQILVNLINKKGYELPMGQAYARTVEQLNDPRLYYTHFDFHNECKSMRWDRIMLLVDQLKDNIAQQSYFHYDTAQKDTPLLHQQTSVIRSNCMDCLDRTNVAQSTFARGILTEQLRAIGVLDSGASVEQHAPLMLSFRRIWADNADAVSVVYSGTGALKTDFTRTGTRTKKGALQDLSNSIMRYWRNNFMDGDRMDGFDLFLGHVRIPLKTESKHYSSPFAIEKPLRVRVVPYVLVFSLLMLMLNIFQPSYSGFESRKAYLLWLCFWVSVVISAVRFSLRHGHQLVQWPHLVALPVYKEGIEEGTFESKGEMMPPETIIENPIV